MSKGKKSLAIICGAVAPLFLGTSAFAGMTVTPFAGGAGDDWPTAATGGAPTSAVGSNPVFDTGDGGSGGAPDSVIVNNSVTPGLVLSETFNTGATGFNLGELAVYGSGAPNSDISVHLFQMITQVTGTTGGYVLSTAAASTDLLGGGAGLSFTFAGGAGNVYEFVFNNSGTTDQVALAANTEYAFEFWDTDDTTANTGGFFVGRGTSQYYSNGQEYNIGGSPVAGALADNSTVTRGGVSGGGPRNMSFALYAAPPAPTWIGNPGDGLWTTAANWLGGVPNSAGISATFGTAITGPTTVNLNGNETVGKLNFNTGASYTIAQGTGGGTLTLDNAGAAAQINDSFGNHTISAPIGLTSFGVTIAVGQSTNTMTLSGAISGTGGVTLSGTSILAVGTVVMSGANSYQGATTVNTGTLELAAPGTLPSTTSLTIGTATTTALVQQGLTSGGQKISGLTINTGSVLDIENNHTIVTYGAGAQTTTDTTIRGYLTSGYNAGGWNGTTGITSSVAAVTSGFAVGYADGADGVVTGLSSGQLELKYTRYGDANLDGVVSGDDFTILVGNLGKSVSAWDKGDFNYDGVVSGDDFTLLVGNLGKAANGADVTLPAADIAAIDAFAAANGFSLAAVPEPASAGLLLAAGLGFIARRRRN